jgi:hypothetical protein
MADSALFGLDLGRDPAASKTRQLLTIVQPQLTFPPMLYNPEVPMFWPVMKFYEKVQFTVNSNYKFQYKLFIQIKTTLFIQDMKVKLMS